MKCSHPDILTNLYTLCDLSVVNLTPQNVNVITPYAVLTIAEKTDFYKRLNKKINLQLALKKLGKKKNLTLAY